MKVAFITTVLNEEKNIVLLLKPLLLQSKRPDEVIIIDGGSKDDTVKIINEWISKIRSEDFKKRIKLIVKKGNRSVCRNEAIKRSNSEIITSSDSGCILDKNWTKKIISPFKDPKVDVVAGFYKGITQSIFEKSLVPYVLVMPDKVQAKKFLPSARSMAFRKEIWEKVGGFPVQFSSNEDYVFSKKLKKYGARIVFKRSALVYYLPRKNIIEAFSMFFNFAMGDSQSGILRPKVAFILIRYTIILWLLIYMFYFKLFFILEVVFYILVLYIAWAILKNYKYVKDRDAIVFLPLIQFTSDIAIIIGTILGFLKGLWGTKKKH